MRVFINFQLQNIGMSRYDIVLYGASGFTGAHVFKLLLEEENVNFAVAGRSEARLKKLLENTGRELGELFAKFLPYFSLLE